MKTMLVPCWLARAVRPQRWMYTSAVRGTSKWMTQEMAEPTGKSSPRAATSVARMMPDSLSVVLENSKRQKASSSLIYQRCCLNTRFVLMDKQMQLEKYLYCLHNSSLRFKLNRQTSSGNFILTCNFKGTHKYGIIREHKAMELVEHNLF